MTTDDKAREAGQDFIRDIVQADLDAGRHKSVVTRFPPGAERLPAHRPRQVDLPQLRHRPGVRRPLQPALRRHQPDQGGAGVHRRHQGRCALARLRLGQAPLLRVRLLRDAVRLGRAPDQGRQGLCRRPEPGGDARQSRHADGARQEQPVPRALRGGEPGSVPPHAGRRVPERRARAARQDRHGERQHQPARSRAVSHPARHASAHRDASGRSIRATTTRTASRMPSSTSRTRSARWSSRITGRCTTGSSRTCPCRRGRGSTSSRGSTSPTRCCPSAC